jgi:hypothetical protein
MSLVVAGIHNDHITMVADTKVSFYDRDGRPNERQTRDTYFQALPKVVLLRPDLLVGVTGDDPDRVMERLVTHRDESVAAVFDHLRTEGAASFVVAALDPLSLWVVADGHTEDRTSVGRAWAGDIAAFELFQARSLDPGMSDADPCFKLMSSMQWLTSFNPVKSVGGTTIRLTSRADGFHFSPMFARIGPHYMEVESATFTNGNLKVTYVVPGGVDGSTYQIIVVPGGDPTPGALGLLIPETGRGLVFSQERPWESDVVAASTVQELAGTALAECGQVLTTPSPPPQYW